MDFPVDNDNLVRTLKVITRFLQKNKIIVTMRRKKVYEKPSEMKIRKFKEAAKKRKRNRRFAATNKW